jgi:ribosome modulation factor
MTDFHRGRDLVLRAYDDGVEQGSRGASPGDCPFQDQPQRAAWVTGCLDGRAGKARPARTPIRHDGAVSEVGPSLRTTSSIECELCGMVSTSPEQITEVREIEMFGAARYAWCLLCHRKVEPPWSEDYKQRWDRLSVEVEPK